MIELPEPMTSTFIFALGLILGSFLNVCIYRLPKSESVVHPRSRCRGCGTTLSWHQNVPVVSWIVLRGKCATCGAGIAWRYPFVELLSGVALLGTWRMFGPTHASLIAGLFTLPMIVLFFTDWDEQLLPDVVTLSGFAVGIVVAWFNPFLGRELPWARVWMALSGAARGAGVLWSIGALYGRLRGVDAMGMGDVKMMAMVGAFTGPLGVLFTLFAASVVGAVVGLAMIPLRGRSLQDTLPFGCFLAPAAVAALLFGRQAVAAYFRLVLPGT